MPFSDSTSTLVASCSPLTAQGRSTCHLRRAVFHLLRPSDRGRTRAHTSSQAVSKSKSNKTTTKKQTSEPSWKLTMCTQEGGLELAAAGPRHSVRSLFRSLSGLLVLGVQATSNYARPAALLDMPARFALTSVRFCKVWTWAREHVSRSSGILTWFAASLTVYAHGIQRILSSKRQPAHCRLTSVELACED